MSAKPKCWDVAVVGAGAAGLMTAIVARRLGRKSLAKELEYVFDQTLKTDLPPQVVMDCDRGAYMHPVRKWLEKGYLERIQLKGKKIMAAIVNTTQKKSKREVQL